MAQLNEFIHNQQFNLYSNSGEIMVETSTSSQQQSIHFSSTDDYFYPKVQILMKENQSFVYDDKNGVVKYYFEKTSSDKAATDIRKLQLRIQNEDSSITFASQVDIGVDFFEKVVKKEFDIMKTDPEIIYTEPQLFSKFSQKSITINLDTLISQRNSTQTVQGILIDKCQLITVVKVNGYNIGTKTIPINFVYGESEKWHEVIFITTILLE